ncbi:TetR/AcrR family transcriptional regulator [Paenibacillus lautus]|uniref:TetR/AcrR family transcriptional regulator n=1 Tax=Paenibacillus lautus TaxID=1401 RepID=UPI002DBD3B48|nr:TetR/AcrR family transcriptional regulator [Paenibacillus lautus]MEC0307537.1 TetR/AcrR family transcriptional regulator [Paenibacillus lautus]
MNKDAKTSINRRTDIISAAIEVFAETGYYRATTAQVAQRVQISQPYVFRFFATKEQLLLSALEVSWLRIFESFHQVIESASSERLEAELIEAFRQVENSNPEESTILFLARGMLCNVAEAIRLPELKES